MDQVLNNVIFAINQIRRFMSLSASVIHDYVKKKSRVIFVFYFFHRYFYVFGYK